ncbi:winged helix-turn-helix transcriptional regulator [Conexibacter arvalis]|uniref:DNA-binding HxlR family transcriptional regulator n=1 Tax=Conexibacter arvalis TaxID=912552 RepID=A0A840IBG9_9ACTN|nr:helix-turn-helix domain-containing protein [Conexibacter arvalis]MBB4661583.1 DNA-binding HxlR family transcriptional regulator [Conexibacter arvalis]
MTQPDVGGKPRRQWAPDARALNVVGDRWLMVIVRDLAAGPLRLDELRRWLPGISAGALESRLAKMADERLIVRRRMRSLPPRVDLELTERGRALLPVIGAIARWELRTQWSRPHADEWVDVAACFRLAPFLRPMPDDAGPPRELGLTIEHGDGAEHYAFVEVGGRARVERRRAIAPAARISGSQEQWVHALSPGDGSNGLRIEGDGPLAADFLARFERPRPPAS